MWLSQVTRGTRTRKGHFSFSFSCYLKPLKPPPQCHVVDKPLSLSLGFGAGTQGAGETRCGTSIPVAFAYSSYTFNTFTFTVNNDSAIPSEVERLDGFKTRSQVWTHILDNNNNNNNNRENRENRGNWENWEKEKKERGVRGAGQGNEKEVYVLPNSNGRLRALDVCRVLRTLVGLPREKGQPNGKRKELERKGLECLSAVLTYSVNETASLPPSHVSCIVNNLPRIKPKFKLHKKAIHNLLSALALEVEDGQGRGGGRSGTRIQDISLVLHGVGKMGVKLRDEDTTSLLDAFLHESHLMQAEPRHITQVLLGLSKQRTTRLKDKRERKDKVDVLVSRLVTMGEACEVQELANSMMALGDMKHTLPEDVFSEMKELFLRKVRGGDTLKHKKGIRARGRSSAKQQQDRPLRPMAISQFLLGVSKSGNALDAGTTNDLVSCLMDYTSRPSEGEEKDGEAAGWGCNAQVLGNSMKAVGDMGHTLDEGLFENVKAVFLQQMREHQQDHLGQGQGPRKVHPIEVSQFLVGVSKSGNRLPTKALDALAAFLVKTPTASVSIQALANSIKALGDMGHTLPEDLFEDVKMLFLRQLREEEEKEGGKGNLHPMAVSQFLLGVAKSGNGLDEDTLTTLLDVLVRLGPQCSARQLANSVFALGHLGLSRPLSLRGDLVEDVKDLFLKQLRERKAHPMDISQFFLGLSKSGTRVDHASLEAMLACLLAYGSLCNAQALGNSILALSNLGCVPLPRHLFEDMKRLFLREVEEGKAKPMEVSQFLLGASKSGNAVEAGSLDTLARCLVAWGRQGHCNAQVLANSIKALGVMEHTLPDKVVDDLTGLFMERKQRGEALPINVSQFEWGRDKIRRGRRTT